MSVDTAEAAGIRPARLPRTVWRDDLIAGLTGFLLMLGLFTDGWNHLNLQNGKAGEFVTPWHGLLYAGFNACAVWAISRNERLRAMLFPSRSPRAGGRAGQASRPGLNAMGVATIGLLLIGAGLAGDALTRSTGLRGSGGAIAPPFDFLLFTGAGLVFAIGLRAALGRISPEQRRIAIPATLALGAGAAALFAFSGGSVTTAPAHGTAAAVSETPGVAQVQAAPAPVLARAHAPARVTRAAAPAQHARSTASVKTVTPVVDNSGPIAVSQTPSALPTTHGPSSVSQSAPSRPVTVQRQAAAPVQRRQASVPVAAPKRAAHHVWTSESVPQVPTTGTSTSTSTTTTTTVPDAPTPATAPKPAAASPAASPAPASNPTPVQAPATNGGGHQGPH